MGQWLLIDVLSVPDRHDQQRPFRLILFLVCFHCEQDAVIADPTAAFGAPAQRL